MTAATHRRSGRGRRRQNESSPKILIVASEDDLHAQVVGHLLAEHFGVTVVHLDFAAITPSGMFSLTIQPDGCAVRSSVGAIAARIDDVSSVWWRRPTRLTPSEAVTDLAVRGFCEREFQSLVWGAFEGLGRVINRPSAEIVAARKPYQLRVAQEAGLSVPRTIVTNDPEEMRAFWHQVGGSCIYKALTAPAWKMIETRQFTQADFAALDGLRHAPAIFQELIIAARHIRVTMFGKETFAAAIDNEPGGHVDHRLRTGADMYRCELPKETSAQLDGLRVALGLDYACVDLVEARDGTYWFLEINPSGQFLYVEMDTGMPLAMSMARLLADPDGSWTGRHQFATSSPPQNRRRHGPLNDQVATGPVRRPAE